MVYGKQSGKKRILGFLDCVYIITKAEFVTSHRCNIHIKNKQYGVKYVSNVGRLQTVAL